MKVAGIVLFNPDIKRLTENLNAIITQVDNVVCVDNHSKNIIEIRTLLENLETVNLIENRENCGMAMALNQILQYAKENECEWFLTLDQDSVAFPGLIVQYEKYTKDNKVAILTSIIKDRNTDILVKMDTDYIEIKQCITSGSYNRVDALLKVGGFDEKMFIDYVDFDVCNTLRENGYKIIRIRYLGLLHEVGKTKVVRFLGKKESIYNHSPFRKYYIIRNHIYFIKKHKTFLDVKKEYSRVVKYILLVILYENRKGKKIIEMIRGIRDGVLL